MGWQDDAIVQPIQQQPKLQPWERDAVIAPAAGPRAGSGILDAIQAGYQGSATGLMLRNALPEVQLDPHNNTWYERLAASATQMAAEFPQMVIGSVAGATAGTAVGGTVGSAVPVLGTAIGAAGGGIVGGGAGAFALPAAIRTGYIEALSKGQIRDSADFLERTKIVLKQTGKEGLIGGLTAGLGKAAGVASATAGLSTRATAGVVLGTEGVTLAVAPAALEGRFPEARDFMDVAILLAGLKGATAAAGKLQQIYAKTGKTPAEVLADAKADPTIAEDLAKAPELAVPELPRAYREVAARDAAENAFPGEKAQQVVDSPYATLPEAKLPHEINLKYIEAPQDVQALLTRMADVYRPEIDAQRNGKQSHAATEAEAARQLEDLAGPDALRVARADRAPGDPVNTVEIAIRRDLLMKGALEASEAVKKVQEAGSAATDAMKLQAHESIQKLAMIQAELNGAAAEAARALQYMQAIKGLRDQSAGITRLYETLGNKPDAILEMAGQMPTPADLVRMAKKVNDATAFEKYIEVYRAGLMSGIVSVGANVAGNFAYFAQRMATEPVAVAMGAILRSPDRATASGYLARVYGSTIMAPLSMIRAGWGAFQAEGITGPFKSAWEAGQNARPEGSAVKNTNPLAVGFVKAVYGTNSMLDAMFRSLTQHGEIYSMATDKAIREGLTPGSKDFFARVKDLVAEPTDSMLKAADDAANRSVFAADPGKYTQLAHKILDTVPILRIFAPFTGTPANILKETFRNSPFAPLVGDWLTAVKAGGATRDRALAEMAVGTALFSAAAGLAMSGRLTGFGDTDPKKRATLLASGWQPYSYKTDDGTYVPLVRLAPTVGTMMGMAADIVEMFEHMDPEEQYKLPKMAAMTFKNAITNQTMLQGITNVLKAMDDGNSFAYLARNTIPGMVVPAAGLMGNIAGMHDEYQREVYTVLDGIQQKIPLAREELQPRRDIYGEKAPERERPLWIAPVKPSQESTDKARTEAARLKIGVAKAPDHIELRDGGDPRLGRVELTPQERDLFATSSGQLAYTVMSQIVNTPLWDATPDLVQRNIFNAVFEKSRAAGKAAVLTPERIQTEAARIAAGLELRLAPK